MDAGKSGIYEIFHLRPDSDRITYIYESRKFSCGG